MATGKKTAASSLHPPEPISTEHDLGHFACGEPSLDDWLGRRALPNEVSGASRTYVVFAHPGESIVGYYTLAAGAIGSVGPPLRMRGQPPDPIPVMMIGRLAVDLAAQGRGIGRGLLRDAVLRMTQAANIAGMRAMLAHAISQDARKFYERAGFHSSPVDPMTLLLTMDETKTILARSGKH